MAFDLKTSTPITAPAAALIFGAASALAANPSVYTTTGSGNVALATSPTFVTPNIDSASGTSLTLSGATVVASAPVLNLSQTWNNAAVTFTGLLFNAATGSSAGSASGSALMDLQLEGTSVFKVSKSGVISVATGGSTTTMTASLGNMTFGGEVRASICHGIARVYIGGVAGGPNVYLTAPSAFVLQLGTTDNATPAAQTVQAQGVVAGTSNTAGQNLTINGSRGTGTGAGGDIIVQVAPAGTTGTSQNALAQALRINSNKTVVVGAAYTVSTLPAAGTQGRRAWVTDATAPTFLGTLTGGGSVVCPVFDNGTAWVSA